jgi:hypothetical protein
MRKLIDIIVMLLALPLCLGTSAVVAVSCFYLLIDTFGKGLASFLAALILVSISVPSPFLFLLLWPWRSGRYVTKNAPTGILSSQSLGITGIGAIQVLGASMPSTPPPQATLAVCHSVTSGDPLVSLLCPAPHHQAQQYQVDSR